MKRAFLLCLACLMLCTVFSSCVRRAPTIEVEEEEKHDEPEPIAVSGGWTLNTAFTPTLTEAESGLIRGALLDYEGVGFTPAALLARQIVAGTNYAYLCLGEACTEPPTFDWWIVTVHEDLSGEASVIWTKKLALSELETLKNTDENGSAAVGAWQVKKPQYEGMLTQDSELALKKALEKQGAFEYFPVATLGTQTVAGTNYCILVIDGEENAAVRVLTVFEDLAGNCEITQNDILDLTAYVIG